MLTRGADKGCWPVVLDSGVKYRVWRHIPGTRHKAYCGSHETIEDCCKALKKRFPSEAKKFTPRKLLLTKPEPKAMKSVQKHHLKERPVKRMEKVEYKGVTPETRTSGKVVWKVHDRYDTPKWRYDSQKEAARAICAAEGITLKELKFEKAKLPRLSKVHLHALHGKAMHLYYKRRPGDCVNADGDATLMTFADVL